MEDIFAWLQRTYFEDFCNGDWEHSYGITIETTDNPGWFFSIDLINTDIADVPFEKVRVHRAENDWYICFKESGKFKGGGGPQNLQDILEVFRAWYSFAVDTVEGKNND